MTALPDEAATNALQCLKRRERPPQFPALDLERKLSTQGFLRAKLSFDRPDGAPKVEILANTANERMQDEVLDYLGSYRLPCMKPGQAPIIAVQEFVFDALASPEGKPLRLTDESPKVAACLVMPRQAPVPPRNSLDRGQTQVMIEARFAGAGAGAPEVKIVFSDASNAVKKMVLDYLAEYRMPCRVEGDKPFAFQQHFFFAPENESKVAFKESQLPLRRFLPYIKGVAAEQVYFDFGSMACPFQVEWIFMQPVSPNEVRQLGSRDLNRTEFSAWLAGIQLAVSEHQGRQLLGSSIVIDVPCGVLDLRKKPTTSPSSS
ncbi:hypothetical protein BH11PSE10_BH11PSE10_08910 [soil metagenome]